MEITNCRAYCHRVDGVDKRLNEMYINSVIEVKIVSGEVMCMKLKFEGEMVGVISV